MLSFVAAGVFIALTVGVVGDCPQRWHAYGSHCYFVSHDMEDWPGSLTICRYLGGELVKIDNGKENTFITNLVRHSKAHIKAAFWIGLTDIEKEGTYVWAQDKTTLASVNGGVANWGHNQPDNSMHDQNCVWLNGNHSGQWYDGHCHFVKNYICEKAAKPVELVG